MIRFERRGACALCGCTWGVLLLAVVPALSAALGLGDIKVRSTLNEPLQAEIELLATDPREIKRLAARLAPKQDFEWVGIERAPSLEQLIFTPAINRNGGPVIEVRTDSPLRDGFVNFLLEVRWPKGRLLREYTIELATPILMSQPSPVTSTPPVVAAPDPEAKPDEASSVPPPEPKQKHEQPVLAKTPTPFVQTADAPTAESLAGEYKTVAGDTLGRIAQRYRPSGVAMPQMLLALYRANPHAFLKGNMNYLKRGVVLRIPTREETDELAGAEAMDEVQQQTLAWAQHRARPLPAAEEVPEMPGDQAPLDLQAAPTPVANSEATIERAAADEEEIELDADARLEIIASQGEKAQAGAFTIASNEYIASMEKAVNLAQELAQSRQQESEELKLRLRDLESVLQKQERLIKLQNEQVSELQQRLTAFADTTNQRSENGLWLWLLMALLILTALLLFLVFRLYQRR